MAIPLPFRSKFYIVSCAMKARKSAKKCTTNSEFQPFTFLFSHLSASSLLVAFCTQQFWMHDNFIENWWFDGKCRTKKMSAGFHRGAPFSRLKLFPWLPKCWNTPARSPQIKSFPKEALKSVTTSTCGYIAWNTYMHVLILPPIYVNLLASSPGCSGGEGKGG